MSTVEEKVAIDYPENIRQLQQVVRSKRTELEAAENELARRIEKFQDDCSHDDIKAVWVNNPDFKPVFSWHDQHSPREVIKHRVCTACGKVFPKRTGAPWKVCEVCGGDMEFVDKQLRDQDWWTIYRCLECKNTCEGI